MDGWMIDRQVVVATNVAEASITIDNIIYVVDCGFVKLVSRNEDQERNSNVGVIDSIENVRSTLGSRRTSKRRISVVCVCVF